MFEKLTLEEIRKVADFFGVDYVQSAKVPSIAKKLKGDGISEDDYAKFKSEIFGEDEDGDDNRDSNDQESGTEKPEVKKEEVEQRQDASKGFDKVVLKLVHGNRHFETHGYVFTRESPFVALDAGTAQSILDQWGEKFKLAQPREVQEYYS